MEPEKKIHVRENERRTSSNEARKSSLYFLLEQEKEKEQQWKKVLSNRDGEENGCTRTRKYRPEKLRIPPPPPPKSGAQSRDTCTVGLFH